MTTMMKMKNMININISPKRIPSNGSGTKIVHIEIIDILPTAMIMMKTTTMMMMMMMICLLQSSLTREDDW
jgi:hypothetical protein